MKLPTFECKLKSELTSIFVLKMQIHMLDFGINIEPMWRTRSLPALAFESLHLSGIINAT